MISGMGKKKENYINDSVTSMKRMMYVCLCSSDIRICSDWTRDAIECLQRGLLVAFECLVAPYRSIVKIAINLV